MKFPLGIGHESAKKPLSPEELVHLERRETRLESAVELGRAILVDHPELRGVVISEIDLAQPEHLASDGQNTAPQSGNAPIPDMLASAPMAAVVENANEFAKWEKEMGSADDFAKWEQELTQMSQEAAENGTDYEPAR